MENNKDKWIFYTCKNCSSEFKRMRSDVEFRKRKNPEFEPLFCSRKCMHDFAHKNIVYHDYICLECGNMFQKSEREIKNANKKGQPIKFCSRECKDKHWGRNQLNVKCDCCGKDFKVQQKFKNKKHYFCSSDCCKKFNEDNNLRGTTIDLICKKCGKTFTVTNSYLKKQLKRKQNVVYCSLECKNSDFINFKKKYDYKLESLKCEHCGKKIEKSLNRIKDYFLGKNKHIYCSNECAASAKKKQVEVSCDYCHKKYTITESRFKKNKNNFCCLDHKKAFVQKEKETYAEISHYLRTSKKYNTWRLSCMERDDFKCIECHEDSNLIVHHINELYNIVKKYNFVLEDILNSFEFNDINNGMTLCKKCHNKKYPWLKDEKGRFVNSIAASSSTGSEDDD